MAHKWQRQNSSTYLLDSKAFFSEILYIMFRIKKKKVTSVIKDQRYRLPQHMQCIALGPLA